MEKDEEIISNELTKKKCLEVSKAIDGLKLPEVLVVLSMVFVELVYCAKQDGVDVKSVVSGWLKELAKSVKKRDYDKILGGVELLN